MRILVCGGRDFDGPGPWAYAVLILHGLELNQTDTIIHGGARGADSLAERFCKDQGIRTEVYPADWKTHGKKAGILRNIQMLKEGKPDNVIAFPGGKGTAHMMKIAREANIPVYDKS